VVDNLTVSPDAAGPDAWVLALLLNAGQVGGALRIDDTFRPAEGRPACVAGQAGAGLVTVDHLAFGVWTARGWLARDLRSHGGRDFFWGRRNTFVSFLSAL
jgi:hypothetical protein